MTNPVAQSLVRVALPVPLHATFDYLFDPTTLTTPLQIGQRVSVPFGAKKTLVGVVVDFPQESAVPQNKLKPILESLDRQPIFPNALWDLLHWGADYYHAPLGEVLTTALPAKLRQGASSERTAITVWQATKAGREALSQGAMRAKKQQQALADCVASEQGIDKKNNEYSSVVWNALLAKGFITETIIAPSKLKAWWQDFTATLEKIINQNNCLRLNDEQAMAMSLLENTQGFQAWLLDGVTGSGKTEVYLQVIAKTLMACQQVLVLVPEIGLTPQTVQRFQARFNVPIDVLHSNVSDGERLSIWQRIKDEETAILIGTRSALFSPFANLGLIVIDEEHDRSFKQQDGWRYNARDVAVMYAYQQNIPIILGSATPSLETLHNVQQGKYRRLTLKKRAGKGNPLAHFVIDMTRQPMRHGLSVAMIDKIQQHLANGDQVLLFLNRRGFAPALLCHECGWVAMCQHCNKPFTYHQKQRVLRCHHCDAQRPIPMQCGACGSTYLIPTGLGTEQLESNLQQLFPKTPIVRIDRDSVAHKGALEQRLNLIHGGESQILIGTQMLAKGHHFPDVTMVGMLDVDGALFSVDYRAEEQLAQLYVQVSGRAGRGDKKGEVVLQTHFCEHPLLQTLLHKGYGDFAEQALQERHALGLPPFSTQVLFKAQSLRADQAEKLLENIAHYWRSQNINGLEIIGPMPAPMAKRAGQSRFQLLLQHPNRKILQHALKHFPQDQFTQSGVRWQMDVDPLDFT